MQAKRIQVAESDIGAGGQVSASLVAPTDPREEINFHNIWASFTAENITSTANAQGTWLLILLKENMNQPTFSDATVNAEASNAIIIGCGVFSCSNEAPYTSPPIHPSTSRTLQAGDTLAIVVNMTGVSAGSVSTRVMICAHTTRK